MTIRLWCGWPGKSWKGAPGVCPCGFIFPERFHPNADGSWPRDPDAPRARERLPEPRKKRERLDLFDDD